LHASLVRRPQIPILESSGERLAHLRSDLDNVTLPKDCGRGLVVN
jgi:hypothetical protein